MLQGVKQYLGRYAPLNGHDDLLLSQLIEIRSFAKQSRLTEIGEQEQYLNFVLKGMLRKFFYRNKQEVITHLTPEGNILASGVSFFSGKPSKYCVEAIEPTVVASISRENLERLFSSDPKWEMAGFRIMSEFLVEKDEWLLDKIRYTPRERFLRFMEERPELVQRIPQKYLAALLDIKPETFSRLKHLIKDKKNPKSTNS
jgi:CRP-like cAMP-binding protein